MNLLDGDRIHVRIPGMMSVNADEICIVLCERSAITYRMKYLEGDEDSLQTLFCFFFIRTAPFLFSEPDASLCTSCW